MLKSFPPLGTQPDFGGFARFRAEHGAVGEFECRFFLPESEVTKMWVLVRIGAPRENPIVMYWRFSSEFTAGSDVLVAEEIFHSGYTEWDWGNGAEDTLVGEITRLTINHGDVGSSPIVKARFAITSSALLRSADHVGEANGQVVVRTVARSGPVCSVSPDVAFRFGCAYTRGAAGRIDCHVVCDLVEPTQMQNPARVVPLLEDVLAIASLAERRLLMVTGWTVSYTDGATATCFRRDFTPPPVEEVDVDRTLISLRDIEDFLNRSLQMVAGLPDSGALKQAIYFALHGQAPGIGDSFVMLFAGIETLLNLAGSATDGDPLVPKTEWQPLFECISTALRSQETFLGLAEDAQERLLDNIDRARHASFRERFERMCSVKSIDLTDLWPMLGNKDSLYAVRNRIVHGRVFSSDQEWFRVVSAKFHLLWSLERSILCFLGWPVERSRSSSNSLRGVTFYNTWRADRVYFASRK